MFIYANAFYNNHSHSQSKNLFLSQVLHSTQIKTSQIEYGWVYYRPVFFCSAGMFIT